uniref:U3 small nucleolar RNA-associated protein 13 C-terminal domain-containing protein n=1 Tax=Globisporangium ultimum (strain ATCC 200006 / CBS 805.95 / DAOM BR144) TaxID=431595 RepID=K3WQG2_GLOUD
MSSAATAGSYSNRSGLSKSWKTVKTHAGVYTGGKVEIFHHNGASLIACMLHDDVAILNAKTGELKRTLQQDIEDEEAKESFVVFAVRPGHNQLVTAGRNLLLRLWDLDTFTCLRTIKAHDTPVLAMDFDPTGTLLATGGSDRAVKVFDIEKGYCTHNFRRHSGIVTLVKFHPDAKRLQLVSCSDDSTVRIWDLYSQKEFACIQDHMSPATCVTFSTDGYTMLTAGRDRVVNFWDLRNNALRQTVVIHEAIEGIQVLPSAFKSVSSKQQDDDAIYFVAAGERGLLQLWCATGSSCNTVFTQKPESDSLKYTGLLLNASRKELMAISADQNFLVFNEHLARTTQIIGFNDDILNLKYISNADGTPSKQIAVATNSDQIRLINRETLSCELLSGHTDIVMALAVSPDGKWLIAFELGHPNRLLQILRDLLEGPRHKDEPVLPGGAPIDPDVFVPEDIFAQVITSLDDEQLKTLLDWVRDWNTNAKHSAICQVLISSMLRELPPAKLKTLDSMGKTLEALIAYSERHFQRIDRMLQKSYLVDFSIVSMKNLFPVEELSAAAALTADATTTSDESEQEEVETEEPVVEEEVATKSKRRKSAAPAAGVTKNHVPKKKLRV